MIQSQKQNNRKPTANDSPVTLDLSALSAAMLPLVGGKAANLGELHRARLSVPEGFCITTAAYERVSSRTDLETILTKVIRTDPADTQRLASHAKAANKALLGVIVPEDILKAIGEAYNQLSGNKPIPVAVRSSATAEDLPFASFAGQQDTYLNIIGMEALLDAVKRCWASLWTDRGVAYRSSNGIDHRTVRLAVVVQRMIDAKVSGVLFTANPLTGQRHQAVIDASFGLGEAIVSGAVNPDHFVANPHTGEIMERRSGDKQFLIRGSAEGGTERIAVCSQSAELCLADAQAINLARLGLQVEEHFGAPQDIEWAIDSNGHIWLTQSRPITTLYPLPASAPADDAETRAYLSFGVQQGTHQPFTPMGVSAIRLLTSSITTLLGFAPGDPLEGPGFVTEAASRVFLDVTGALRSAFGRSILINMMAQAEAHASAIFSHLGDDARFSLRPSSRSSIALGIGRLLFLTRAPWHLLWALAAPKTARNRLAAMEKEIEAAGTIGSNAGPEARLAAVEKLFLKITPRLMSATFPVMAGSLATIQLAGKLLGDRATAGELQVVVRGAPFNPTTEMSLSLWALAQSIRDDPELAALVAGTPAEQLAKGYLRHNLPASLQDGAAGFLGKYGHRGVNELDMGMLRWSEDPAYLFSTLFDYLELSAAAQAPDIQYRHAGQEAEAMIVELVGRARRRSWLSGLVVGFLLRGTRALGGLREMPRYLIALMMARSRVLLRRIGEELVQASRLADAEDIFFVSLPDVHAALAGTDLRDTVKTRREVYDRETARRHVPLVLLSDGTEPSAEQTVDAADPDTLRGIPTSPGVVTALARVILDPRNARLAPGEILVAPSTDPGWTPLFLKAGGLVMETGGEVSHGAIVARECGIPAVVGVRGATERIWTGQMITVYGTTGVVNLNPEAAQPQTSDSLVRNEVKD